MKTVNVVAAIIEQDGKYFATQRGYGEFKDWWEFPGGKIETGETPKEALRREIKEELNTMISVDQLIKTVDCDYPAFHSAHAMFPLPYLKRSSATIGG
jgi:8-oxo-dGTP diphosphatase